MHGGEQVIGEQRLEAEGDVETVVFLFCLVEAADDEYGKHGVGGAEGPDEFDTMHGGHEVIGDDEIDGGGKFVVLNLFEGADGVERGDYEITGTLQDGLARGGLYGIVIDEKQSRRHPGVFFAPSENCNRSARFNL